MADKNKLLALAFEVITPGGRAPNEAWIYIYSPSLECTPTLQGQEHQWLGKGCLPNHVCPSYEVQDHLYNMQHAQYISHTERKRKISHFHTPKDVTKTRYRKRNPNLGKRLDMVLMEKDKRKSGPHGEAKPPNLLIYTLLLASSKLRMCSVRTCNKQE